MPEPHAISTATLRAARPPRRGRSEGRRAQNVPTGPQAERTLDSTATATSVEHDVIYDEPELTDTRSDQYHSRERTNG